MFGKPDFRCPENYKLQVTAGSSYDESTHQIVTVNDTEPLLIDGPHMTVNLHVRVRDFTGLPSSSPNDSIYFDHHGHRKDRYSIAFSFVPKKDVNSKNLVWGNDFDHPIRDQLPPAFPIALKIAKLLDPGIECDAYSDRPWAYGPALSCWFSFRIGERKQERGYNKEDIDVDAQRICDGEGDESPGATSPGATSERVIEEGADGEGCATREHHAIPETAKKRRRHFLSGPNREAFNFEKGRLYHADFYNPYFDPNKVHLRLPGIQIRVLKYVNERTHTLRYVFKDSEKEEVYLIVVLKLLFGEELEKALERDKIQ